MNFIAPTVKINVKEYKHIISLGNRCPTAISLRDININRQAFPFDYITSTPALVLKYLKDQSDFFPERGQKRNKDGCWFGHFDTTAKIDETIETFKKRFERLFGALNNKEKILFVYSSEADIYNEFNNRYNDNYQELLNIVSYLKEKYNYNDFTIVAAHVNKIYKDSENIVNLTINVPEKYFSDDLSTYGPDTYNPYRRTLTQLFKEVFINE